MRIWGIDVNSRYLNSLKLFMRFIFLLILWFATFTVQAQNWQNELLLTFRDFNAQTSEQAYMAGIKKLDAIHTENPGIWQTAYYTAWYHIQFLQRSDFKTQRLRESYLLEAEELIKPSLKQHPNEELYILNAYINLLRLMWLNESGALKYKAGIETNLEAARLLSSEHPRLKLVEGLYIFYGSSEDESTRKDRSRELLMQAEEGFKTGFITSYPLMPSWGWEICEDQLKLLR